jgi:hypothetical protein
MGYGNNGIVHHLGKFVLMDNINASSNYTSNPLDINSFVIYAIQFSWTGFSAPTSAIYTEGSNDGNTWTIVDSFIPNAGTGSRLLNVEKAGYAFVRVRYSQLGGAGTINAILNGKVT